MIQKMGNGRDKSCNTGIQGYIGVQDNGSDNGSDDESDNIILEESDLHDGKS